MELKAVLNYKSHLTETEKTIGNFLDVAVGKSLLLMELNIKKETPVKHGYLKRSITNRKTGFAQGEVFTNPIGNITKATSKKKSIAQHKEVSYAVYVEYGTKYMAPRAMFRKGVSQSEERIKQIFAEEAKKASS